MDLLNRLYQLYGTQFSDSDNRKAQAILRRVPAEAREDVLSLVVAELDIPFHLNGDADECAEAQDVLRILARIVKRLQRSQIASAEKRLLDKTDTIESLAARMNMSLRTMTRRVAEVREQVKRLLRPG
ncbi:MAG: hypothetical protein AAGG01_05915 [Planctomycetota bacterium]